LLIISEQLQTSNKKFPSTGMGTQTQTQKHSVSLATRSFMTKPPFPASGLPQSFPLDINKRIKELYHVLGFSELDTGLPRDRAIRALIHADFDVMGAVRLCLGITADGPNKQFMELCPLDDANFPPLRGNDVNVEATWRGVCVEGEWVDLALMMTAMTETAEAVEGGGGGGGGGGVAAGGGGNINGNVIGSLSPLPSSKSSQLRHSQLQTTLATSFTDSTLPSSPLPSIDVHAKVAPVSQQPLWAHVVRGL
jgi:hypothetical protein